VGSGYVYPEAVKVMKRLLFGITILVGAAVLGGCPIYPSSTGSEYRVCDSTGCYSCPDTSYSGACIGWQCSTDSDCGSGYVCSDQGACVPAPAQTYDAGNDCTLTGCPDGYVCKLANGVAQCVAHGTGTDAGASTEAGTDASTATDAGSKSDASDAATIAGPCNADGDCGGHGARCVDGQCTPQVDLCSDGSQCVVQGSACVDGLCEARCSGTVPCPSGFGCDFTRGVCNLDPGACTGSGTASCQGGAVCVEGHCAPPCAAAEAGAACAAGLVCVNGGCIPDQAAHFACANDGDEGQLANSCLTGFTCLHHDCYPSCNPDAGTGCGTGTAFTGTACKNVTIETGTYGVCGTATMLGSDCDPAQGKACASGVCVDGYCK
jgi:hypothetical protein